MQSCSLMDQWGLPQFGGWFGKARFFLIPLMEWCFYWMWGLDYKHLYPWLETFTCTNLWLPFTLCFLFIVREWMCGQIILNLFFSVCHASGFDNNYAYSYKVSATLEYSQSFVIVCVMCVARGNTESLVYHNSDLVLM